MKRWTLLALAAALAWTSVPAPAGAGGSVDIHVRIGDAPPPPRVVFRRTPRMVVVPATTVYYVGDDCGYDVFRYGAHWYVFNDGWWYRARHHRGPFTVVEARYVPRAVINVPPRYWRHPHGGPPGHARRDAIIVKERGHGRGPGRGPHPD
jgi:hypothetical protein